MAYELDFEQDLASAVRTAARERLKKAAAVLRDDHDDPAAAVHQARKEVKKSRSLLRLMRPALGNRTYRYENRTLRDAARSVAHVRDADVMVETVDGLHARYAGHLPARAFTKLRNRLAKDADRSRAETDGATGGELTAALTAVALRVDDWPLDSARWSVARDGVMRAYKRGREAFAVADADPTTENLHEFRKRAKDLWYQQRLLKRAWPAVLGAQADEAHRLSDLLGDDHDLALLAQLLHDDDRTEDTDAILELIDRRRDELLAQVRAVGSRVYTEKPKQFKRRLKRYMRTTAPAAVGPGSG